MKDLKLNKDRLLTLQQDQIESIIGGGTDPEEYTSCPRKSCNPGSDDEIDV